MLGYRTLQNYTDRAPDKRDMAIFKALIEHTYQDINFFSFQPKDFKRRNFGCCTFQLDMYKQYGQGYGMSPAEYYLKLFDLRNRTEGRELVFAKSEWDPDICMNILSKVSFGRGLFRDTGGRGLRFPYLLPPLGPTGDEVIIFNAGRFKREFTFTWFLENVICQEKPGICDPNYQRLFEEQTMAMTMVVNT
ncbi:uncharacterized protein LOC142349383 [Convolutriloba macropyga]|uniref:uncharacterized protein LOC142349383 n=1 Tax=Convolutriloba macropyga TaxID=536237 RepID=UPI003F527E28